MLAYVGSDCLALKPYSSVLEYLLVMSVLQTHLQPLKFSSFYLHKLMLIRVCLYLVFIRSDQLLVLQR